ncbi:MAG: hypothetical protein M3Y28_01985, partial [Armatimonadota bacterium]|nr:hypothetical protein [Armatimonadota bacterium]
MTIPRPPFTRLIVGIVLTALLCCSDAHAAPLSARNLHLSLDGLQETKQEQPVAQLSPDGRWLAWFRWHHKNWIGVTFYDLTAGRSHTTDLGQARFHAGKVNESEYYNYVLAWRQDSQACAVGVGDGWAVLPPTGRYARWLVRSKGGGWGSCAAWAPLTHRLAMFDAFGDFRVWDGKRLRKMKDWAETSGAPHYAAERAWQCEWSPDEKAIAFRFYGEAERQSDSAGHTMIVDSETGRQKYRWGAEACWVHWLDSRRLAFRADDEGLGGRFPVPLVVAQPGVRQARDSVWQKDLVDWALAPRHDALWAVTNAGDVSRTPTAGKHWKRLLHGTRTKASHTVLSPFRLLMSPQGDQAAVWTEDTLTLISASGAPARRWRLGRGQFTVLGWPRGKALPLLAVQRTYTV